MQGVIQSLEVAYLVHATEAPEKIRLAVARLLGQESTPETEAMEGHFGNQILRAKVHLTGKEAESAFGHLVSSLPPEVLGQIVSELGAHIDEHSALFVRLDKQSLVSGHISLGTGDPVRVKVKPRGFLVRGRGVEFFTRLLRSR